MKFDFVIIGAGIVGAASAFAIAKNFPRKTIAILEKETAVGVHQSGHNSGVIHAGIYYAPGSFKSKLCRAGLRATYDFCEQHGVRTRQTGKLLVATTEAERRALKEIANRSQSNAVSTQWKSQAELNELEPAVNGICALHVADSGIVNYQLVAEKLVAESGAELFTSACVEQIDESVEQVEVATSDKNFSARQLVVCGGLQADRLANLAGVDSDCEIIPFRGDFYELSDRFKTTFNHLIYPVPNPKLPFLGVHITQHIDDSVSVGPSAMLAFAREKYHKYGFDFADALKLTVSGAFWKLLCKYPKASFNELTMAMSRARYLAAVQRYCRDISLNDLQTYRCGIRAQAVNRRGELVHDFLFAQTKRSLHVLNAPSPAATAAIPIGELIADKLR